jgi:hypothetical protein
VLRPAEPSTSQACATRAAIAASPWAPQARRVRRAPVPAPGARVSAVLGKPGLRSRVQAVIPAYDSGLVTPGSQR